MSTAAAPAAPTGEAKGTRILGMTINHGSTMIFLTQVALFCLYGGCTTFAPGYSVDNPTGNNLDAGNFVSHIFIGLFVFVGLGFLFNQNSNYSWQAIGYSLAIGTTTVEWAILILGFFDAVKNTRQTGAGWAPIPLDFNYLTNSLYIAATVLISYSALIGRVSFAQAYGIAFLEVFFATANYIIAIETEVMDAGGTFFVHTFGGAFGLFASLAICNKLGGEVVNQPRGKTAGALSILGLVVLFVTFPVFNIGNIAYLAMRDTDMMGDPNAIQSLTFRGYFNTIAAMASSIAAGFLVSKANSLNGDKFSLWQIQVAAVAGGSAVGATGVYLANPFGALMLGAVVGVLAVLIQTTLTPALAKLHVHDTNGVLAAHLVPGIIGGVASAVAASRAKASESFSPETLSVLVYDGRSALWQGGYQMAFCAISLGFGIIGGLVTGAFANLPIFESRADFKISFGQLHANDADEWEGIEAGGHTAAVPEKTAAPAAAATDAAAVTL